MEEEPAQTETRQCLCLGAESSSDLPPSSTLPCILGQLRDSPCFVGEVRSTVAVLPQGQRGSTPFVS
jgi:hypothetical protein